MTKFSRSPIRYGKSLNLDRKRSLRKLTHAQQQQFSEKPQGSKTFANFRHHGSWWLGHVKEDCVSSCEMVLESFQWGPIKAEHRYLKFNLKEDCYLYLEGQEEKNKNKRVVVKSLLFSPEGVAYDDKIRFFPSLFPFYSVAYCFRTGDYLRIRARTEGVTLHSKAILLSTNDANRLFLNCLNKSTSRCEKDVGHMFHNCGTIVYQQLLEVQQHVPMRKPFPGRILDKLKVLVSKDSEMLEIIGVSSRSKRVYE